MKPNPQGYGVTSGLKPVKPSSDGVGKMVSVLVSVADQKTPKPLLHTVKNGANGRDCTAGQARLINTNA